MEKKDAHQAGLAKIVLPKWWNPCPGGYNFKTIDEMMIDEPMKQVLKGNGAIYQMTSLKQEEMTVKVYKNMISESPYTTPMSRHGKVYDHAQLERRNWKHIAFNPIIYEAGVPGTLFSPAVQEWYHKFNTLLITHN